MTSRIIPLIAIWVMLLLCPRALPQESLSTLRGTVTDNSGASVSGAAITALEVATNIKARVASSDSQGNFEMPGLKQGVYRLTATPYFNAIQNGRPLLQFPNPFPAGAATATIPSQSANGYPKETTNGYIQQFSRTAERQIRDVGVRLSYVGSRNSGVNYSLNINKPQPSLVPFAAARRPYPQLVNVNYARSDGRQLYNSLTVEAKRKTGWVTFDGYWTWAHNMVNYLNLENPYNALLWNRDEVTQRHRAVINSIWEIPVGRGKRFMPHAARFGGAVLGGWKLGWVAILQTGQFFSPSFSGSDPSGTNTSGGRPDRVCNGNLNSDQRQLNRWFDAACFAVPPTGRFGNAGVNILEVPASTLTISA
jgi:hypothetical protein